MKINNGKSQSKPSSEKENEKDKSSVYGSLVKHGLASLTTNAMVGAVAEGVTAAELPDGGQALSQMPDLEGGGFVERPMAGAMADSALEQSLEMTYGQDGVAQAAEGSGLLTVNGHSINVPDYLPGSDIAKLAMGQSLDAGDGLSLLMEQGMGAGTRNSMVQSGGGQDDDDSESSSSDSSSSSGDGSDEGKMSERAMGMDNPLTSQPYATGNGKEETSEAKAERVANEHHEVQIEKENLEIEHRVELREALRTQDLGTAVTERTGKHGSLRLETQFEARHPDNDLEQKKGEEHVTDVMRSPRSATRTDNDQIHLLTLLHEQEKENDRGISRF